VPDHGDAERRAITAFCDALPFLRTRAAAGFWEDTLEMHVAEVAEGGSAAAACRELNLELDDRRLATRGGEPGIDGAVTDWLPAPQLVGAYTCPLRRCARRADRDEQARPPRCALTGDQMTFVRRNAG
jgi:hypothetical protein